jgi:hypothetical protein
MVGYANRLRELGCEITAQWVDGSEEGQPLTENAIMDFEDVMRADLVVSFTEPYGSKNKGGGRHTELGMAYALGIDNWIIGEREQIFHHLPEIRQFDSFEDVVQELSLAKVA